MNRKLRIIALFLPIYTILPRQAPAINRSWDGGGNTNNWSEAANWRPNNTPQSLDDVEVSDFAFNVTTIYNVQGPPIGSLVVANSADVDTDGHQLRVEGDTVLLQGATIIVRPNDNPLVDALDTDTLTVTDGADVVMQGGILEVDGGALVIEDNSSVNGLGLVELTFNSGGAPVLELSGAIAPASTSAGDAALTIRSTGGGTLDSTNDARLVADTGVGARNLVMDLPLESAFQGTIEIGRDDTVDIVQPWQFDSATVNFNAGQGVATLTGAPLTGSLGSGPELNVTSGTAEIENDLLGSFFVRVADNSTLQLDGTADVNLDFNHANVGLIVNGDTTIAQTSFRWAGSDDNSTTIIGPGGALNIDVGILDPTDSITFDAVIHVNSGDLTVIVGAGRWVMQGALNIANTTGQVPALFGDPVEIGNGDSEIAEINVSGDGISAIHANVLFRSDADVDVVEGATLKLTGAARFTSGSATMLNGRLQLESDDAQIDSGASFTGSGRILNVQGSQLTLGDAAIVALLLNNKGDLELESGAAATATAAAFEQTSTGVLHIDLAGTATGDFDWLLVAGAAQLDGTLDVSLFGGFNPLLDDEFTILSAALGVSGRFDTVNSPVLDAGLALHVVYNSKSVVVKIGVAGDFDGDGDVDGADFVIWQTNFPTQSGATLATGDADGDGDVDGADFVIWQTNFPFTPAPAAAPVPEPAAWLLAIFSLTALAARFRRSSVAAAAD